MHGRRRRGPWEGREERHSVPAVPGSIRHPGASITGTGRDPAGRSRLHNPTPLAGSVTPARASRGEGGHPLTTPITPLPQPELTLSSQRVPEAGWAGGSHAGSGLRGNSRAAKMQFLAWKRGRTPERTPPHPLAPGNYCCAMLV